MIVITRRRIEIILSCIFISLFAFSFHIANLGKETENIINEKVIETTSTPVSGKTVVIDAGHGKPDEGAESSRRNNRGRNEFKNSFKVTKSIRTKWIKRYINSL